MRRGAAMTTENTLLPVRLVSRRWRRSWVILAVVGYLALTGWLSLAAAGPGTVWWDHPVQRSLESLDGPGWNAIAAVGNAIGNTLIGIVILLAAAVPLLIRHRYREIRLLAAIGLVRIVNTPLKWLLDSPRPPTNAAGTNDVAVGLGFPSGHAMGTFLIGGALVIVVFHFTRCRWRRWTSLSIAIVAVIADGFGRVAIQAHWPSDVLGGWLLGAGLLGIVTLMVGVAERRFARRRLHQHNAGA